MNASIRSLCKLSFLVNFHSSAVADLSATNKDSCRFGIATNPSGLSSRVTACWSIRLPSIEKYFGTTNNLFSIGVLYFLQSIMVSLILCSEYGSLLNSLRTLEIASGLLESISMLVTCPIILVSHFHNLLSLLDSSLRTRFHLTFKSS
jgi:hypothetical protein